MKRDLVKIGTELCKNVPFHTIVREFDLKGEKARIRVGWPERARVEVYRGLRQDKEWVEANWSAVPRPALQSMTKSIKAEAASLLVAMDDFIEKECEAEIKEMVTDVICKVGETKSRSEIFIEAMASRLVKMSNHFQKSYARPTTFNEFKIQRTFEVPKPKDCIFNGSWNQHVTVVINEGALNLDSKSLSDVDDAMLLLLAMPQIAEFALKIYMQLDHLAKWEKSQ